MTDDELNACVAAIPSLPRVRFETNIGDGAENWLKRKHATLGDAHEPATLAAFLAAWRARPSLRQIYDVGALYGYFSLFALGLFDRPKITAFEMHPGIIDSLRANVEPYASVVEAAVSDECAPSRTIWISGMNIYEEPEGGWEQLESIPGAMKQRGKDNRGRGFTQVDFVTLDQWSADHQPPELVKIDVEGYQAKAVCGGLQMFAAHKPIVIIELHDPEKMVRFGVTNAETVKPFFDLGYRGFWCGNFRDRDARFEEITDMAERHEKLSLMVFAL